MALFRSAPEVPLDQRMVAFLVEDSPAHRRALQKHQNAVRFTVDRLGERIVVIAAMDGGQELLVVTDESVCQFNKTAKLEPWKRFTYDEIVDVHVYREPYSDMTKLVEIETLAASQYSLNDLERYKYILQGKVSGGAILVIVQAIQERSDPNARMLKAKYRPFLQSPLPSGYLGTLRLWSAGPAGMEGPIGVAWKVGDTQFEHLYRGNSNFDSAAMAADEAKKAIEEFDRRVSGLHQEGWHLVGIDGRNLTFQHS